MKKILLTGGGTAGHVTPNIALLEKLKSDNWDISYIGTKDGIEKRLIEAEGIKYYSVSSGKLRRYMSKDNFTDIFKVMKGVTEAASIINKIKPDVIFSKGGFVAVPVVLGGRLNNVPIIIHESDITPGLANKIAMPFSTKVCTTFPETLKYIPKDKGINTGTPIRSMLFKGDKSKGLDICDFDKTKPVIMMMGGSLGSVKINTCLRKILPALLKDFQLVHLCGKGNIDKNLINTNGYKQFEYISGELPHLFAAADIIISRAGSNSISEFLALKKPNLLIPLSGSASRGDQILNANSFKTQGFSVVLPEEEMTEKTLENNIYSLYETKDSFIKNMASSKLSNGVDEVIAQIYKVYKPK